MESLHQFLKEEYGIVFDQPQIVEEAFTHSSYVNEHRQSKIRDNERLEFLGDAVLEIVISDYLFKKYPDSPEGFLTRTRANIVQEHSLYEFSVACQFDRFVRLGRGEEKNQGRSRKSLLADLFEAFLGALYLDQGMEKVFAFMNQRILPKLDAGVFSHGMDFKTTLQEYLQQKGEITINYQVVDEIGPQHEREFVAEVRVENHVLGQGSGSSKKVAEQAAAKQALERLKSEEQ